MRHILPVIFLLALFSCSRETDSPIETYRLTGKILSRDATTNRITTDHDAIPGFMEAMEMAYEVRGASVKDIPPDNSRFEAVLHVKGSEYWVTDVRATAGP